MSELDDRIRKALKDDEVELYEELGEGTLYELAMTTFRTQSRKLIVMTMIVMLVFMAVMVWAGLHVYRATDALEAIRWALVFMFSALAVGSMKIWSWMEMNRVSLSREMKRIELQLASLAERLDEKG